MVKKVGINLYSNFFIISRLRANILELLFNVFQCHGRSVIDVSGLVTDP